MNAYLPPSQGPKPTQSELVWVSFYSSFCGGVRSISSGVWRTPLSTTRGPGPRLPWDRLCAATGFTSPGCAIRSPVPPLSEALGVVGPQSPLHNMGLTSVLLAWQGCWETLKGWEKTGGEILFRIKPHPHQRRSEGSNKPCDPHPGPGPRDPTETETELRLSISCRGMGQQWTAARAGALGAVDLGMA